MNWQSINSNPFVLVLITALGFSFLWKAVAALVKGEVCYFSSFLPLSIVSPLLIHLPTKHDPLVKRARSIWVALLGGPVFLLSSAALIIIGFEGLGIPATDCLNLALNLGHQDGPEYVHYSRTSGFQIPILDRLRNDLWSRFFKPPDEEQ